MSDKTLNQLIALLKTEAIDAAEQEKKRILEEAEQQAREIVQSAEDKRNAMISNAEREAQSTIEKGEAALRKAGRDYSISVRNELLNIFSTVLEGEVKREFTPDLLKKAIIKVIENVGSDVELKLSKAFSEELADYIHTRLISSQKLVSMVEDNSVLQGFSITNNQQGWSYTISTEEVTEALKRQLNTNWIDILKKES